MKYLLLLFVGSSLFISLPVKAEVIFNQDQYNVAYCPIHFDYDYAYEYIKDTVPERFTISEIDLRLKAVLNTTSFPFEGKWNIEIWDLDQQHMYAVKTFDPNVVTTSQATYTFPFNNEIIPKDFLVKITTDTTEKNFLHWHRKNTGADNYPNSEAYCSAFNATYSYDYYTVIRGEYVYWQPWFGIPIAKAECQFVTTGATTTTNCDTATSSIQITDDPTRNIFFGLVLFFITFFGLIFYFKKS